MEKLLGPDQRKKPPGTVVFYCRMWFLLIEMFHEVGRRRAEIPTGAELLRPQRH